jgi:hypothetical protein
MNLSFPTGDLRTNRQDASSVSLSVAYQLTATIRFFSFTRTILGVCFLISSSP